MGVGAVELGDEVGRGAHAPVRRLAELGGGVEVAGLGGDSGERVEREDLDVRLVVPASVLEDRDEPASAPGT